MFNTLKLASRLTAFFYRYAKFANECPSRLKVERSFGQVFYSFNLNIVFGSRVLKHKRYPENFLKCTLYKKSSG